MSAMPPAPDPCLEETWKKLDSENLAAAILSALALTRTLRIAGAETLATSEETVVCPSEKNGYLPAIGIDLAMRLLSGEFPEILPEWMLLATATDLILPPRVLPELLSMAGKNQSLRAAASRLAGERGLWIARRNPEFSWLLEGSEVGEDAWETGQPSQRIAWLRQTRADHPSAAADVIASHWAGEDAAMREGIMRLVSEDPQPCDDGWLESLALADRRQDIRELAAVSLMKIPASAFRARAIARLRGCVKTERRLLKRIITVTPPAAYDPAWAADGIKEKPLQGIGEKAWWLRQITAQVPLEDWPDLLSLDRDELFSVSREKDWEESLLAGWIESARRFPDRAISELFIPFIAKTEPWPQGAHLRPQLLQGLLESLPADQRYDILDQLAKILEPPFALDLLARCGSPDSGGKGKAILSLLDREMSEKSTYLTRPQARALAICIPPAQIKPCLERLAKLPSISPPAEEFATVLEFRRTLPNHFTTS
jgi:hypothetical protein